MDFELYFVKVFVKISSTALEAGKEWASETRVAITEWATRKSPVAINTGKRTLLLLHSSHCIVSSAASFQSVCHRDAARLR